MLPGPVPLRALCSSVLAALLVAPPATAEVELKKPTLDAFQRYVKLREPQIDAELKNEKAFLWIDRLPAKRRAEELTNLKNGEVAMDRLRMHGDSGKDMDVPDGLIHHWIGTVFIPGATVKQAITLVQDYDRHAKNYSPEVILSRTIERKGDCFKINMRFLKKKMGFGAVIDTDQDVCYTQVSPTRAHSRAYTRRVQQINHLGEDNEKMLPVGKDDGFMWELYTYWHFEERDGGTYVQCEAISLSRDIPWYAQLFRAFITSVPKESLMFSLGTTRSLLLEKNGAQPASTAP